MGVGVGTRRGGRRDGEVRLVGEGSVLVRVMRTPGSLVRFRLSCSISLSMGRTATPHSAVDETSLYKHIDADLPDSARARQLLLWCSMRCSPSDPSASTSNSKKRNADAREGKDPPLSDASRGVLNTVIGDTIKLLAEKHINTNVYSPQDDKARRKLRPNEQNEKNRVRHIKFSADIERCVAFLYWRSFEAVFTFGPFSPSLLPPPFLAQNNPPKSTLPPFFALCSQFLIRSQNKGGRYRVDDC